METLCSASMYFVLVQDKDCLCVAYAGGQDNANRPDVLANLALVRLS
jgi:hypothetical protein